MPRRKIVKKIKKSENDIHLISYGNNVYKRAKKRLQIQGENLGWFKTIKIYSPEDLTEEFSTKYNDILSARKGGGYWIWKIDIIEQRLKELNDNDFLIYIDAGCTINPGGKKRFQEYLEMLSNSDYGIISFDLGLAEKNWTTKEIFDYFELDLDSEITNSGQYHATVLIMKKNKHLLEYLSEMKKILEKDRLLFTDYYNKNQESFFKDNRHDQSISSIIRKKIGSLVIDKDETFFSVFGKGESVKYPFWATRIK